MDNVRLRYSVDEQCGLTALDIDHIVGAAKVQRQIRISLSNIDCVLAFLGVDGLRCAIIGTEDNLCVDRVPRAEDAQGVVDHVVVYNRLAALGGSAGETF